jgi:tetratricopeptide (TPR) repeat protein
MRDLILPGLIALCLLAAPAPAEPDEERIDQTVETPPPVEVEPEDADGAAVPVEPALTIGDAAPGLEGLSWRYGRRPDPIEDGITVILFWATWSVEGMAGFELVSYLSEFAYDERVSYITITPEPIGRIDAYLERRHADGNDPVVPVTCDPELRAVASHMWAAGETLLPTVFIVDSAGRLAWVGDPRDGLETALDQMLHGSWDLAVHRRARALLLDARQAQAAGDRGAFLLAIVEMSRLSEVYASQGLLAVSILAREDGRADAAWKLGRFLVERYPRRADVMRSLAMFILDRRELADRDLGLALDAARAAVDHTPQAGPIVLHTLARAYYANGRYGQAVEWQELAVESAKERADLQLQAKFGRILAQYRRKAASASP